MEELRRLSGFTSVQPMVDQHEDTTIDRQMLALRFLSVNRIPHSEFPKKIL